MSRMLPPETARAPETGETLNARKDRLARNRDARRRWERRAAELCAQCGHARINVLHETDPATAPEGPAYYADFLHELHDFAPAPAP